MTNSLPSDTAFRPDKYGWTSAIPAALGCFLGHPVDLEIHTSEQLCVASPPAPSDTELVLAELVLTHLSSILRDAEAEFTQYNDRHDPAAAQHIRHPHIWICREFIESGTRWAFVVERDDAPDFGYHVEFDGYSCLGMNAGD